MDPLSPFLFTLDADGLNTIIKQAFVKRLIKRLPTFKSTYLNNLQYVGDTILFGQMEVEQVIIIKCSLYTFELWSGSQSQL